MQVHAEAEGRDCACAGMCRQRSRSAGSASAPGRATARLIWAAMLAVLCEVARGMAFLHAHSIIHGDLTACARGAPNIAATASHPFAAAWVAILRPCEPSDTLALKLHDRAVAVQRKQLSGGAHAGGTRRLIEDTVGS